MQKLSTMQGYCYHPKFDLFAIYFVLHKGGHVNQILVAINFKRVLSSFALLLEAIYILIVLFASLRRRTFLCLKM